MQSNHIHRIIFILLLACSSLSAFNTNELNLVNSECENCIIHIENSGEESISFNLKTNNGFATMEEIKEYICNMEASYKNELLVRKAWRFVFLQLKYLPSLSEGNNFHHPLTLINSIGYGQCDDLSVCLMRIWEYFDFEARIWNIGGHVVPEVKVAGKWQMYDPSFRVFYLNRNGQVAGVEELSNKSELISNAKSKLLFSSIDKNDDFYSIHYMDSLKYTKFMVDMYATNEDNVLNKWYESSYELKNMSITLAKGMQIDFAVELPENTLTELDWRGNTIDRKYFCKVTFPKNFSGEINLPFVYFHANELSKSREVKLYSGEKIRLSNSESEFISYGLINNNLMDCTSSLIINQEFDSTLNIENTCK